MLCVVQTQPCPILTRNKVHYNVTVFSDDIERLYQTAVHPQETETIWFQTAIGKPCTTVVLVLGKLYDAAVSPKHKFVSLIGEKLDQACARGSILFIN